MGLFDGLVRRAVNSVMDSVGNDLGNVLENKINNKFNSSYSIPEKYNMFPKYNSDMIFKPYEMETDKYSRYTMTYRGRVSDDYISSVIAEGFNKATDVRYDKDNLYIIIEYFADNDSTKIAYHIKK